MTKKESVIQYLLEDADGSKVLNLSVVEGTDNTPFAMAEGYATAAIAAIGEGAYLADLFLKVVELVFNDRGFVKA